ncbi:MAG: hypothetical protein MSC30_14925 [Gaiellaceae bacterium MAG52_C11]|nr:hypothetical protein [Candidatus Gaiellasilicea maunaloa]
MALQSLILGAIQISIGLTIDGLIVVTAGSLAVFLSRRPAWIQAQRYLMGGVLAALALRLATDRGRAAA